MRWPIFRRPADSEIAPEFVDAHDPKLRAQLEKSCGRDLGEAWTLASTASGERVREAYLWSADLQKRYPVGLLPVGQKRMAKWLLKQGRAQHSLGDAEIVAFLRETATELQRGIAETYLITPDWQRRVADGKDLLRWLREQFPNWRALRKVKRLPGKDSSEESEGERGVNLLAHFCYPSGLQQGALATKASLEAAGIATSCRDVPVGVQTKLLPRREWLGREVYDTSLVIMSPVPYSEHVYERAGLDRRDGVYRIAYWSWELDTIPDEWPTFAGLFDEIWTPTEFVADAMRTRFANPVHALPHSLAIAQVNAVPRADFSLPDNHFVFLFMFDLCSEVERKNPRGLIRAFRLAFARDEKVTLLIKTVRGDFDPEAFAELKTAAEGANIVVVNELTSRERTLGLMATCDAYVSLHRSEGFGLTLAESMLLGKPVIATGYSGNLDFMNAENSWLVDYRLVPVAGKGAIYRSGRWAEPDEEHAAGLMREVFENSPLGRERAARGERDVASQLAPKTVGGRMKMRLDEIALDRRAPLKNSCSAQRSS